MDFPAGKHSAIVGVSGSGKSTLAALAARLYDPDSGSITLDGRDIRNINTRHLRAVLVSLAKSRRFSTAQYWRTSLWDW